MTAFDEMGVLPEISKAVDEMEWTLPTDVQAEAIPLILGGGDVLMAAETGSGKTGAFCLPILQIVWETLKDLKEGKGLGQTSGSVGGSTKWVLSAYDRGSAFAVTPEGLRCQSREIKEWHGCRAMKGVYGKGKYYFEAIVADEGLCRVGWSTPQAALDLGTDRFSFGFGGTGKKSHNKNFDDYGEAFGKSDVIGCCLNLDQFELHFLKNGVNLGLAFSIPTQLRNEVFYPAVVLKNAEMQFNFGDEKFKHEPPQGFTPLSQSPPNNVKQNTIGNAGPGAKKPKIVSNAPQAIIIEPSRELADQTFTQLQKFRKHLHSPTVRDLLVVGGVSVKEQIAVLNDGVDIVVGTPGRLEDLIGTGNLALSHCRFFVLDEADGLLKSGYGALINRMHQQIPKMTSDGERLQMIICSATLHDFEVKKLAERLMHFPTWVDLKGEDAVPETVHHVVVRVDPRKDTLWHSLKQHIQTDQVHGRDNVRPGNNTPETLSEATKILKGEYCIRAIDTLRMDQALIFCRTKVDCDNLENYFKRRGVGASKNAYSCVCLHGDRKPHERKENLEMFKAKAVKFLICTDVAARGIDISGLPFRRMNLFKFSCSEIDQEKFWSRSRTEIDQEKSHSAIEVINVTLPDEKSNYVHRIGRVGRAERMGLAVSLVSTVPEKVWYHGEWCSSRGRNCTNVNLIDQKGCCTWYDETQYLADIEEHLGVTIQQIETDINVPSDEFDGKVVYGQKRTELGSGTKYHLDQTASSLAQLTSLETNAQKIYLNRHFAKDLLAIENLVKIK